MRSISGMVGSRFNQKSARPAGKKWKSWLYIAISVSQAKLVSGSVLEAASPPFQAKLSRSDSEGIFEIAVDGIIGLAFTL
jgi:hypothetical protein